MKRLLFLLLLMPVVFAASWQEIAAISIMISVSLLAVVFMIGMGFGVNELQMMAKEEFFQVIVVALMVAVLMGSDGFLNSMSQSLSPTSDTIQNVSLEVLDENIEDVRELFRGVAITDLKISREASKSSQCNIQQLGYSVSSCGGYSLVAPALATGGGIIGFALGELSSMHRLIELADAYALGLLLPVGILLRTFKVTRGAGGFLMALGIGLHFMLPIGIIFNEMLAETFISKADDATSEDKSKVEEYEPTMQWGSAIKGCNPADTDTPGFGINLVGIVDGQLVSVNQEVLGTAALPSVLAMIDETNEDKAANSYMNLRVSLRSQLYIILIKASLGPILALLLMASSIKALTSIAGAEVDVSALGRFV
jgi:hypothetical protein